MADTISANQIPLSNLSTFDNRTVEDQDGLSVSEQNESLLREGVLVVLSGFICNFLVFGIAFTFGVFQEFYISDEGPLHNSSQAVVSIIGTVATAVTYICGIFNSRMLVRFGPKTTMSIGSVLMSLGLILTGFCNKIWQFIITEGFMFGVGSGLVYMPPVVCAPPYFTVHRGIALGLVFAGTGAGGLAMAPFSRFLLSQVGWRWAVRILGFLNLFFTQLAALMVKQHPSFRARANVGLLSVGSAGGFKLVIQLAGSLLQSAGYLIPLIYMSTYAQTLGFSSSQGAIFIGVNNGVNSAFKIILGYGADKVGRLNMIVICNFVSAVSVFSLWLVPQRGPFLAFMVLYGAFSGAIISLLPACLIEIFGLPNYQAMSGLMYFSRGVGNMLGSPIAGLLIASEMKPSSYFGATIYDGSLLMASTICLMSLRFIVGSENRWKIKM